MKSKGCVPLALAIYDCRHTRREHLSRGETIQPTWLKYFFHIRAKFVLPAALLSGSSIYTSIQANNVLRSTYICPISTSARNIVPILQLLAVISDCYVLISIDTVTRRRAVNAVTTLSIAPLLLGSIFLVCFRILGTKYNSVNPSEALCCLILSWWVCCFHHPPRILEVGARR